MHIFVDLVKCGVLTLAGEIWCYRNECLKKKKFVCVCVCEEKKYT